MLTSAVKEIVIKTFTEVLTVQKQEEDRMDTLERFDQLFGTSIPDWEQTFIEELTQLDDAEEAIRSVETFISKNQVYDENGTLQYNRFRLGSSHHSLTITYDASAPTGHEFSVEEHRFNLFVLAHSNADYEMVRNNERLFLFEHRYDVAYLYDVFIRWSKAQLDHYRWSGERMFNIQGP